MRNLFGLLIAIEQIPNELAPKQLIDKFGGQRKESITVISDALRASLNMLAKKDNDNIIAGVVEEEEESEEELNDLETGNIGLPDNDGTTGGGEGVGKGAEEKKVDVELGGVGLDSRNAGGLIAPILVK